MTDQRTFVIAGGGLAGAKAAETLRDEGFAGRVVLVSGEDLLPYERPPLSKALLLGTDTPESARVHDEAWYADHNIDLRRGVTVEAIHRERREVTLAGGDAVAYEKLLIATGASPGSLPIPGVGLGGVLRLRTLPDSDRIAAVLRPETQLVIIGAGWIGLEVAAAARTHGAAVTVVETAALPLQRVLGDRIAGVFAELHRSHGVEFRFGTHVTEIGGGPDVTHVLLADGERIDADAVLIAVGAHPNVALAEAAGLAVDNGILVDARLCTSDPDIFAAGDVANVDHPVLGARIRVEHWANALHGGPAAARAMLGLEVSYDRMPYFFTDQYDLGMEYVGWVPPGATPEVVIRGDLRSGEYLAFWTDQGRVLAGMNVNIWDVNEQIEALVRDRAVIPADRLADPAVPLR
ncbi:MAG: FAD-dependent oxidoreductase [Actinoplanes sp.]